MISKKLILASISALVMSMGMARADDVSDNAAWCNKVTKPSNVVICSDPELRRLLMICRIKFSRMPEQIFCRISCGG